VLRTLSLCWAAGVPALAAAQPACPPPPEVPQALLSPNTRWETMASFIDANVKFAATSGPQLVIPCNRTGGGKCAPMVAQVTTEQQAYCLSQDLAGNGKAYFMGVVVRDSGNSSTQTHLGFNPPNATDSVYLLVQSGRSIALFHGVNGKVMTIPQNVLRSAGWAFYFHPEPGPSPGPQAQWRPSNGLTSMSRPHARPPVHGGGPTDLLAADEGDAVQDGTSYAWMACAAGCCQFHGLPAGSGLPGGEDDMGHGRGHGHRSRPRMNVHKDGTPRE
jgi:hypothetical protein